MVVFSTHPLKVQTTTHPVSLVSGLMGHYSDLLSLTFSLLKSPTVTVGVR